MTNWQGSDIGIGWDGIFEESIDSHSSEVSIVIAVDAEIVEDQFFLYDIFGGWGNDHFGIKSRSVNALSCIVDNLLDDFFPLFVHFRIGKNIFEVSA